MPKEELRATDPLHGAGTANDPRQSGESLEDLLQALPEREDLQRLYERRVPLGQILKLMGHQVDRRRIHHLLRCDDPQGEIRRILSSM